MKAIWEQIETWFFVSVITVLVWVYAEGENIKDHDLDVSIMAVSAGGQDVAITAQSAANFRLTVKCSQSQLAELKSHLRSAIDLAVEADPLAPTQTIDIKQTLASMPPFDELGVNIADADPAKMSVSVVVMDTLEMDIAAIPPDGVQLAPGTEVEPVKARVRVPKRSRELLVGQKLEAHIPMDMIEGVADNQPQRIPVPLTTPSGILRDLVTITPATARVTFTVLKQTDSYLLGNVPIWIMLSPLNLQRYDVVLGNQSLFVTDLKITGPSDAIRRIRDGEFKVVAELRLSSDDLDKEIDSVVPYIDLPPGVRLDTPAPRINVKIKPRLDSMLSAPATP